MKRPPPRSVALCEKPGMRSSRLNLSTKLELLHQPRQEISRPRITPTHLRATINHSGESTKGLYTSRIFNDGTWFNCDDLTRYNDRVSKRYRKRLLFDYTQYHFGSFL